MSYDLSGKRVYVAGPKAMVGSAIVRRLASEDCEVLTADRSVDLRDQGAVRNWYGANRPDTVIVATAKVGGLLANATYPADFLYDNLMIEANVIEAAYRNDVGKLLFLGSSCIYPKMAPQPIPEDALLTGPLERTNEWYAIAKIAGIKLCQAYRRQHGSDYISAMPTNLYGPGDNFDLRSSHVLPALVRMHARRRKPGLLRSRSGAQAGRAASSCMSTIWRTGASFCSRTIKRPSTSISARVPTCPSSTLQSLSARSWASGARSRRTLPSPMEPRAS